MNDLVSYAVTKINLDSFDSNIFCDSRELNKSYEKHNQIQVNYWYYLCLLLIYFLTEANTPMSLSDKNKNRTYFCFPQNRK